MVLYINYPTRFDVNQIQKQCITCCQINEIELNYSAVKTIKKHLLKDIFDFL